MTHTSSTLRGFKLVPMSGFEMCFAVGSQHLWCRGSQPKHVSNLELKKGFPIPVSNPIINRRLPPPYINRRLSPPYIFLSGEEMITSLVFVFESKTKSQFCLSFDNVSGQTIKVWCPEIKTFRVAITGQYPDNLFLVCGRTKHTAA